MATLMALRCTKKALALLKIRTRELTDPPPSDDDWYLNLLWLDRRKCLLLTHAETLFPVFIADVRTARCVWAISWRRSASFRIKPWPMH